MGVWSGQPCSVLRKRLRPRQCAPTIKLLGILARQGQDAPFGIGRNVDRTVRPPRNSGKWTERTDEGRASAQRLARNSRRIADRQMGGQGLANLAIKIIGDQFLRSRVDDEQLIVMKQEAVRLAESV